MHRRLAFVLLPIAASSLACASDPTPSGVDPKDAEVADARVSEGPGKIVLIAGGPSHGPGEHEYYAGAVILATMLEQTSGLTATISRGWPDSPAIFDEARAIVLLTDGNVYHPILTPGRPEQLAPALSRGAGFAAIHWAVHVPESASATMLSFLGAHYSDPISVNPHWDARFETLPEHPITRGVAPFQLRDEWYYNMKLTEDTARLVPILLAVPPDGTRFTQDAARYPGRAEIVAWAFERPGGGRSFGFTGAHFHRNWGELPFRRLVVNALIWISGGEVPAGGAPVEMDPALLDQNLDPK